MKTVSKMEKDIEVEKCLEVIYKQLTNSTLTLEENYQWSKYID